MLRINQIKLRPGHSPEALREKVIRALSIKSEDLLEYTIYKQSLDARKKPDLFYSYTIDVKVRQEQNVLKRASGQVQKLLPISYELPLSGVEQLPLRPVVIGSGPAGLFCAYLLAQGGYTPLLLERGAKVEERVRDVERFWETGILDTASNVQFGEGGAGTFSDGKLNTLVKDGKGRNRFVLETFVKHGAPAGILYEQKPHIGTDILLTVVKNMREQICSWGGEIRFHSQVTDILLEETTEGSEKQVQGLVVNGQERIPAPVSVLAVGHSARDTFFMLYEKQVPMEAKAFAVGVRIEHSQKMIDMCQYGMERGAHLPAASYKLTEKLASRRGAYTFCMCPGGFVVDASSEKEMLAVNGMSYHARDGQNANSAVIVTVTPEDYGGQSPLSGIEFQRMLESRAYQAGGGKVPVQRFLDFKENRPSRTVGEVSPQIKGKYALANVRDIFPSWLASDLEEGICAMDLKIPGFGGDDAILSGVESRTSSPVKIERDHLFESPVRGLYPCGEGAGYAGGITSAAMDGMKTAEAIISKYSPKDCSYFTKN